MTSVVCLYQGPGRPATKDGSAWARFTTRASSTRSVRRVVRETRRKLGEGWSVQATDSHGVAWVSDITARHTVRKL